jgi:hypothetical protein
VERSVTVFETHLLKLQTPLGILIVLLSMLAGLVEAVGALNHASRGVVEEPLP